MSNNPTPPAAPGATPDAIAAIRDALAALEARLVALYLDDGPHAVILYDAAREVRHAVARLALVGREPQEEQGRLIADEIALARAVINSPNATPRELGLAREYLGWLGAPDEVRP